MDTQETPPPAPVLEPIKNDMQPLLKKKKAVLHKKLARRFKLLIGGLSVLTLGGGYFLWIYLFPLQKNGASLIETAQVTALLSAPGAPPVTTPRPMDLYANAVVVPETSGKICLVLFGIGQFPELSQQALEQLPTEITLAISPLCPNAKDWAEKAHLTKHEILVTLGLQPDNYPSNDPGPHTLLASLSWEENFQRFLWALEQVPMAVGVTHTTGDYFTTVEPAIRPLVQEVRRSGLFFLETLLSPDSLVPKIAREESAPHATVYYMLKDDLYGDASYLLDRDFRNLEFLAKKNGYVIAVATLRPNLFKKLLEWKTDLQEKSIALLPITALFKMNILKDYTKVNIERPKL